MKSISDIIRNALLSESNSSIDIYEESFWWQLLDERRKSKRGWRQVYGFIFLFTSVVCSLVFVVSSFAFFLKDVLLYPNEPRMNAVGAVVPQRSCEREHVLFLFTSADRWADTGVQLGKGDRVKITASGCFNSDVVQVTQAAGANRRLRYQWVTADSEDYEGASDCIYCVTDGAPEQRARFGSVLYQIAPEGVACVNRDSTGRRIRQLRTQDARTFHRIRHNGKLYLSVNDIYLSDPIIRRLAARAAGLCEKELDGDGTLDSIGFAKYAGELPLFFRDEAGRFVVADSERLIDRFARNRDAWFNDNIGDILISIEIERKVPFWRTRTSWYRMTERWINRICDHFSIWYSPLLILAACTTSVALLALYAFAWAGSVCLAAAVLAALAALLWRVTRSLRRGMVLRIVPALRKSVSRFVGRFRSWLDKLFCGTAGRE